MQKSLIKIIALCLSGICIQADAHHMLTSIGGSLNGHRVSNSDLVMHGTFDKDNFSQQQDAYFPAHLCSPDAKCWLQHLQLRVEANDHVTGTLEFCWISKNVGSVCSASIPMSGQYFKKIHVYQILQSGHADWHFTFVAQ